MGWVVNVTARPLYPQERPGTHCIGGWVGPQGRSGRVKKISPPPGFDPWTVHPIASRYTDWAIPSHFGLCTCGYTCVFVHCITVSKLWLSLQRNIEADNDCRLSCFDVQCPIYFSVVKRKLIPRSTSYPTFWSTFLDKTMPKEHHFNAFIIHKHYSRDDVVPHFDTLFHKLTACSRVSENLMTTNLVKEFLVLY